MLWMLRCGSHSGRAPHGVVRFHRQRLFAPESRAVAQARVILNEFANLLTRAAFLDRGSSVAPVQARPRAQVRGGVGAGTILGARGTGGAWLRGHRGGGRLRLSN